MVTMFIGSLIIVYNTSWTTLKMVAASFSKTWVIICQYTRRYIPEGVNVYQYNCGNFKSRSGLFA